MGTIPRFTSLAVSLAVAGSVMLTSAEAAPPVRIAASGTAQTIQPLIEEIGNLGDLLARASEPCEIVFLSLRQADVLAQLIVAVKPEERETWIRQMADCLHLAATHAGPQDRNAYCRLVHLKSQVTCLQPGTRLAAYVVYRELQAASAIEMRGPIGANHRALEQCRERLVAFVDSYPAADDTPDALMELASVDAALSRDREIRQCYHKLVREFPDSPQAKKADGALRRLELVGQPMSLALPLLFGEDEHKDEPFDIDRLQGRTVVVYCWAGDGPQVARDFSQLKGLHHRYRDRGLELVCVSLNDQPSSAKQLLGGRDVPGVHVFQRDGVNGVWAKRHGVQEVPFVILVGNDGKVLRQGLKVSELQAELAKVARR